MGDLLWLPLEGRDATQVVDEHDALIDAIESRDGERARDLACRHVEVETERLARHRLELGFR